MKGQVQEPEVLGEPRRPLEWVGGGREGLGLGPIGEGCLVSDSIPLQGDPRPLFSSPLYCPYGYLTKTWGAGHGCTWASAQPLMADCTWVCRFSGERGSLWPSGVTSVPSKVSRA